MESISKVIKTLMIDEPYYGLFACSLNKVWDDKIPTLAVCRSGINFELHINKDYWNKLNPDMRYGCIKHELLHLAFFHVTDQETWMSEADNDHELLNIAMDLEVQSYIDKKYWGSPEEYAAERIFAVFPALELRKGTKYYIRFLRQVKNAAPNQGVSFQHGDGKTSEISPETVKEIAEAAGMGTKDDHSNFGGGSGSEVVKSQLEWQLKEACEQTTKARGTIPSELAEMLRNLLQIKPPVFNWKSYFRRVLGFAYDVNYKKTRRKESNRFADSYGLKHTKKHSILVAIDTSGSINQEELSDFFSEIRHIWKAGADIDILECDYVINKQYKYKGKAPENIHGRGGTSFLPCIDYYNQNRNKYNTMVYFTDGYGDQDVCKPFGKVLWIITSNGFKDGTYPGYKICIPKR